MHKKFKFSILLGIMLVTAFFFSCKKESEAGIDLVPGDYLLTSSVIDTFKVLAHTYRVDSFVSNHVPNALIGTYRDPVFGEFKTLFITEIYPNVGLKDYHFGTNPKIDSVRLYLKCDTIYGDKAKDQNIIISQITKSINDSIYNNFDASTLDPELITSTTIRQSSDFIIDTLIKTGDNRTLVLKLPVSIAEKFLQDTAAIEGDWRTDTTFVNYFHGLLISSNTILDDKYSIQSYILNDKHTKLSFFYTNSSDTLNHELSFHLNPNVINNINLFEHTYNSSNFIPDLNNPESKEDSIVYIQGGAGLQVKVQFPELNKLKEQGLWGVNRAELIVKADPLSLPSQNLYPAPKNIAIYLINDEGKTEPLDEYYAINRSTNQISYQSVVYSNNQYIFDLTYIVQKIISGKVKNNGFVVTLKDGSINPSRIVLTGGRHSNPMKLNLTLTKLPE